MWRRHGNHAARALNDVTLDACVCAQAHIGRAEKPGVEPAGRVPNEMQLVCIEATVLTHLVNESVCAVADGGGGLGAAFDDFSLDSLPGERLAQHFPHALEVVQTTEA